MSAGAAAAAAGAAAQAAARKEEEELTPYTPQDIAENWEFKILRSATGAFRNPERLRAILDEEGRAGWTLVEKFDNARVRLKRSARARAGDSALDFDPYRTWVGTKQGVVVLLVLLGSFAFVGAIAFVMYLVTATPH